MRRLTDRSGQQVPDLGDPAPNDDDAGVDQVDQSGDGNADKGARAFDDLLGGQVAAPGSLDHVAGGNGVERLFGEQGPFPGGDQFLPLSGDGMSAGKGFEAAVVPARA